MTIEQWHKEVGTMLPFELISYNCEICNIDGKLTKDTSALSIQGLHSSKNFLYGINIGFEDKESHSYECKVRFVLRVTAKESKPIVNIQENKDQ